MKNIIYLAVVALIGFYLLLGDSSLTSKNETHFRVGALFPLTGKLASYGEDVKAALEISRRDLEAKGVIVEVVYEDSAADPKTAIVAANKLVNVDKVSVIIGAPGSSANLAVAPFTEKANTIFLVMSNASKLNSAGPNTFKLLSDVNAEVYMMFDYFSKKQIKNVSMVYDGTSESNIAGHDIAAIYAKERGINLQSIAIDGKASDFRSSLSNIKNDKTGALYIFTNEKIAGIVLKQARELGVTRPVFGWSATDGEEFYRGAGTLTEGVVITDLPFACDRSGVTALYCRKYVNQYPNTAQLPYGTYGYDALQIIGKIVASKSQTQQSMTVEEIKNAVAKAYTNSKQEGIAGVYSFDGEGNSLQNDFVFRTSIGGVFVEGVR